LLMIETGHLKLFHRRAHFRIRHYRYGYFPSSSRFDLCDGVQGLKKSGRLPQQAGPILRTPD
jgi:hypothetical protein